MFSALQIRRNRSYL